MRSAPHTSKQGQSQPHHSTTWFTLPLPPGFGHTPATKPMEWIWEPTARQGSSSSTPAVEETALRDSVQPQAHLLGGGSSSRL
eukprot:3339094-Amphidinium_carterae.1